MTTTIPARDWELTCNKCDGSGHVYVKHQVAERQSDVQEFKEECEFCEGRGFVFAFQDIPGIEEYQKACRTAPAGPVVSTVEDAQAAVPADVMAALNRMCTPLDASVLKGATADADAFCMQLIRDYILRRSAPAAGDALDAARYRWLRDESLGVPDGMREIYVIQQRLPHTEGTDTELFDTALDAAVDAAVAAQRKGDA